MRKVQMRRKISFLLLAVLAIFLGIVIFHPFSHGLHHDEDKGHECPVCLWLHYAAVIFIFAVVFYFIFQVISFVIVLPARPEYTALFSANVSRAPPKYSFYAV